MTTSYSDEYLLARVREWYGQASAERLADILKNSDTGFAKHLRRSIGEEVEERIRNAPRPPQHHDAPPRGWVVRLASYLNIFGPRTVLGYEGEQYDTWAEKAKQREGEFDEHGRPRRA